MPDASFVVTAGFVLLPIIVAAGFVIACEWASRRLGEGHAPRRRRTVRLGAAVFAWAVVTVLLAQSGILSRFDVTPPPFAVLLLAVLIVGIVIPFSSVGTLLVRGLPLWFLVGVHLFRLPLELVMHQAAVEGIMPVQMSYAGQNFDIVTGITAGALAWWLRRGSVPGWVVAAWNTVGFALLVNIVTVAVVSTPIFRWFGDAPEQVNTFVTYPPYVWLPAILVLAALTGHLVVWRRLQRA